jgi:hypothetical protein
MFSGQAAAGRIAHRSTVRRRRSTIGFAAGPCESSGGGCFEPSHRPIPARIRRSIAIPPRRTVQRRAEKGGRGAGDWPVAWRSYDENLRPRRRAGTPHRHRSDAWTHLGDVRVATALISAVPPGACLAAPTTAMGCVVSRLSAEPWPSSRTTRPANDILPLTRSPIASAI